MQSIGVALGGQTEEIAPADRRLYALRDVTGTVPSISLITASILSKKLAEGLDALVMDVKFGGGIYADREAAEALAQSITALAEECGVACRAVLSDMNTLWPGGGQLAGGKGSSRLSGRSWTVRFGNVNRILGRKFTGH